MLYYYSSQPAEDNNWLHEWLITSLTAAIECVDNGRALPTWSQITAAHNDELGGRTALKRDFFAVISSYRGLTPAAREVVRRSIAEQNMIPELCAGRATTSKLKDFAQPVRAPIENLAERMYKLLKELGIRQSYYSQIWSILDYTCCPFCGSAPFDAPGLATEDLDHYLAMSIYPFASANLRNLSPMCDKCNTDYKTDTDMLFGTSARRCYYPYSTDEPASVSLETSNLDPMWNRETPDWEISLLPLEEGNTWDEVFSIKRRFKESILTEKTFKRWLDDFASWCSGKSEHGNSIEGVRQLLNLYIEDLLKCAPIDMRFLKAEMFKLFLVRLNKDTDEGNQLMEMLKTLTELDIARPKPVREGVG